MPDEIAYAEEEPFDPFEGTDDSGEEGEAEAEPESFDPTKAAHDYLRAPSLEGKKEVWDSLTEEQRAQVRALGIAGPVTVSEDDDFEPTPIDDPHHKTILQMAKSEVKAAMSRMSVGNLSISPELADRIVAMKREADIYPDGARRSELIQRAAHLLRKAESAAKEQIPFDKTRRGVLRSETTLPDGRIEVRWTHLGSHHTEVFTPEELEQTHPEMFDRVEAKLYDDPAKVTIKELLSWREQDQIRFAKEHPKHYDQLLAAATLLEGK
jgi:hypothetical protein